MTYVKGVAHAGQAPFSLARFFPGHQRLLPAVGGVLVGAHEVLVVPPPVKNLVKDGKTDQLLTGARDGMQTLEQSLSTLVRSGAITLEEALSRTAFPRDVRV